MIPLEAKSHLYAVVLNPTVRYIIAPLLSAGPAISRLAVDAPKAQVPIAVVGLALTSVGNYGAFREEGRKERRADARQTLRTVLHSAVSCVRPAEGELVRANIMMQDHRRGGLRMAYMTAGYTRGEKRLVWRGEEGCVGRAYTRATTTVYPQDGEAPATIAHHDAPTRPWGMTSQQIVKTANQVQTVIATPVPSPNGTGEIVGVFSMDSSWDLGCSCLRRAGAVVEGLRPALGGMLDRAGLRFPDDDADVLAAGRLEADDD